MPQGGRSNSRSREAGGAESLWNEMRAGLRGDPLLNVEERRRRRPGILPGSAILAGTQAVRTKFPYSYGCDAPRADGRLKTTHRVRTAPSEEGTMAAGDEPPTHPVAGSARHEGSRIADEGVPGSVIRRRGRLGPARDGSCRGRVGASKGVSRGM